MAKALVPFYPLAGRLSFEGKSRPEIDCNAEGALFVVAQPELTIDDFSDLKPSPELRRLFVPHIESRSIVLVVQVTFLRCGGVALGTAMHHAAIDGLSAFHFFQTWSALCRDDTTAVVEPPCHDRILLHARSPPTVHPDASSLLSLKLNLHAPTAPISTSTKIFPISEDQLSFLKQICGGATTFSAVSALVWQVACVARQLPLDAQTRVSFSVNIRRRMSPPLPDRYFGNALVGTFASAAVKDIVSGTLAAVAARIKGAVNRLDDELLHSAIDYNEMAGMSELPAKGILPDTELRMISWLGMPVYDADFGWGKPLLMSRAESPCGGLVHLMNGRPGDNNMGAVRVLVCMEAINIEEFERLLYAKFA
ncbi:hypothetical protein E2562_017445 [Oryza meyeriana var. granulata]|uniref:Uncharacterized protein n=1 Tax=Oryza meyeriana var. granulata TaxID=110450 RepID=A0A6G1DY02_9ORYZ|nr:hypothetical protein E2562_017445 [Oryza meyeriana var. granulata]